MYAVLAIDNASSSVLVSVFTTRSATSGTLKLNGASAGGEIVAGIAAGSSMQKPRMRIA